MSLAVGLSVWPKVLDATRNEEVVNAQAWMLHRQARGSQKPDLQSLRYVCEGLFVTLTRARLV